VTPLESMIDIMLNRPRWLDPSKSDVEEVNLEHFRMAAALSVIVSQHQPVPYRYLLVDIPAPPHQCSCGSLHYPCATLSMIETALQGKTTPQ
jgi:hypothetical protein